MIALQTPPPLSSVPRGTVSTIRVQVVSVETSKVYQAPVFAKVRVLQVYRGKKPRTNSMLFKLPPCRGAAVDVRPGADLVIYGTIQPTILVSGALPNRAGMWVTEWVDYRRAKSFDTQVR